jgi:hypothetical protein
MRRLCVASAAVTIAGAAHALTITVEPDDYAGITMTNVPFMARLYLVRPNATNDDFAFSNVYSIAADGPWAPTGTRVFGHSLLLTGASTQWDGIAVGAKYCLEGLACTGFRVFGVYFQNAAHSVKVLTTLRGLAAQDPVELWAMDVDGNVIRKCRHMGVTQEVIQTGVLPPPRLYGQPFLGGVAPACGEVVEVKNCSAGSFDCDYVIEMRISRSQPDIGFAWFGGKLDGNSYANVDKLTYSVPFPILTIP